MNKKILRKIIKILKNDSVSAYDLQQIFSLSQSGIVDIILEIKKTYIISKNGRNLHIISKK